MLGPVPAFTTVSTLLARLDALAIPPRDPTLSQRVTAFAPLAGLVAVAAAGLLGWIAVTHHSILHLLRFCPF
jgi:hypothetical protein